MTRMTGLPLLLLLFFWLLPPITAKKIQTVCALPKHLKFRYQWEFHRPDDLIIGGNLPLLGVGFEFSQGDRRVYPSFFQINLKEIPQCVGLVQLLLHFQWNWVGLVAPEDDSGERFISTLTPMLKEKEICLAFTIIFNLDFYHGDSSKLDDIFNIWSKSEVVILFGKSSIFAQIQIVVYAYEISKKATFVKIWIFTSNWKVNMVNSEHILHVIKPFHGALHFRDYSHGVSEFSHFLLSLDPLNPQGDVFLPL
ncbi:hypothetical protein E2320_022280, partial [Naja naja]